MQPHLSPLLIPPDFGHPEYVQVTPRLAEWDYLNFAPPKIEPRPDVAFRDS
jgi:hypothetical protein